MKIYDRAGMQRRNWNVTASEWKRPGRKFTDASFADEISFPQGGVGMQRRNWNRRN